MSCMSCLPPHSRWAWMLLYLRSVLVFDYGPPSAHGCHINRTPFHLPNIAIPWPLSRIKKGFKTPAHAQAVSLVYSPLLYPTPWLSTIIRSSTLRSKALHLLAVTVKLWPGRLQACQHLLIMRRAPCWLLALRMGMWEQSQLLRSTLQTRSRRTTSTEPLFCASMGLVTSKPAAVADISLLLIYVGIIRFDSDVRIARIDINLDGLSFIYANIEFEYRWTI